MSVDVFAFLAIALVVVVVLMRMIITLREWRISRHNRKVALEYVKKFQDARMVLRAATPEEIARFQEQSQRKKRSR